ncbi:hypothetical protein [uncultured Brevundimonas sp.]|uniref:hypothetical protein n=1 Tax=uncultured Brevundimonas sp. TaxID=213418 RepID=UPI00259664A5|nr:hypothetical protein [uncultured Brevundimonas sp.]
MAKPTQQDLAAQKAAHEKKLAAMKARDDQERRDRCELDQTTLAALVPRLEAAVAEVQAIEALCGDLVSPFSHEALRMQANGGPSKALENMLTLARTAQLACDQVANAKDA